MPPTPASEGIGSRADAVDLVAGVVLRVKDGGIRVFRDIDRGVGSKRDPAFHAYLVTVHRDFGDQRSVRSRRRVGDFAQLTDWNRTDDDVLVARLWIGTVSTRLTSVSSAWRSDIMIATALTPIG